MSRDTSDLYTGQTSVSRVIADAKKERSEQTVKEVKEIIPDAPWMQEQIKKEKERLGDLLLAIVDPESPDDQIAIKLGAVRMHRQWLIEMETTLYKHIRVAKREDEKREKEAEEAADAAS